MPSSWNYTTPPAYYIAGVNQQTTLVATNSGWTDTSKTPPEVIVGIPGLLAIQAGTGSYPTFTMTAPANGTYTTGQVIEFIVVPSGAVSVTEGTAGAYPYINMTLTSGVVPLTYVPLLSTPTSLAFEYTVQAGDSDLNGVVVANTITLPSGTKIDQVLPEGAERPIPSGNLTYTVPNTTAILVN